MSLPARTAPQIATITALSSRLTDLWAAADAILQYDGAFVGDDVAARDALDAARTAALDAVASPLFAPGANKTPILEKIAICAELAVASLEGLDLQVIPNLEVMSRETARAAMAECHALVSAAVCGRLTV
jgi:hypothetical protein